MSLTTGTFPAWSLHQIFNFFTSEYFIPWVLSKGQTYTSNIVTPFEYIVLRNKMLKTRKLGWSGFFLERVKFYAEWNNYFCAAHNGVFKSLNKRYIFQLTKFKHKGVTEFWRQKFFQREVSTNLSFSNRNILFSECPKKDQTYISDILTLFEYIPGINIKKQMWKWGQSQSFLKRA